MSQGSRTLLRFWVVDQMEFILPIPDSQVCPKVRNLKVKQVPQVEKDKTIFQICRIHLGSSSLKLMS
jgi:hypothetical protein